MQWYRTPMSEEALTVQQWACSACGLSDASWWFSNRCSSSPQTQIPHVSDIISSPHSPFKSLIRLLLLSHGCRSAAPGALPAQRPLAPGAHLQHGTGQRSTSGGRGWTSAADGSYGGYVRSFPWRYLPCTVVRGASWRGRGRLAARRRSSARRPEVVIGSPRGGSGVRAPLWLLGRGLSSRWGLALGFAGRP